MFLSGVSLNYGYYYTGFENFVKEFFNPPAIKKPPKGLFSLVEMD